MLLRKLDGQLVVRWRRFGQNLAAVYHLEYDTVAASFRFVAWNVLVWLPKLVSQAVGHFRMLVVDAFGFEDDSEWVELHHSNAQEHLAVNEGCCSSVAPLSN